MFVFFVVVVFFVIWGFFVSFILGLGGCLFGFCVCVCGFCCCVLGLFFCFVLNRLSSACNVFPSACLGINHSYTCHLPITFVNMNEKWVDFCNHARKLHWCKWNFKFLEFFLPIKIRLLNMLTASFIVIK